MKERPQNKHLKKGIRFGHGQKNPNMNGRPPKLLSHLNKALLAEGYERVTATQVAEAIELLFNLDETKLKSLALDATQPYFLRKIAGTMGTVKGVELIERMLDRVHGRAMQKTELTGKGGKDLLPDNLASLSFAELYKLKYGKNPD